MNQAQVNRATADGNRAVVIAHRQRCVAAGLVDEAPHRRGKRIRLDGDGRGRPLVGDHLHAAGPVQIQPVQHHACRLERDRRQTAVTERGGIDKLIFFAGD